MYRVFSLIIFLLSQISFAQTFTWTGAGDGTTWHDPANWDQMAVPTLSFHHVIIQNAPNVQTNNHTQCRSLRLINSKLSTASGFNFFLTFNKSTPSDSVVFYAQNSVIQNSSNFRINTSENNFAMALEGSFFTNMGNGSINIPAATSGIRSTVLSKIINQPGGRITIDVINRGMVLGDSLLNRGFIQIDYDKVGIIAQGAIDNRDSLILKGNWITADSGLVSHQNFKNRGYVFIEQNNLLGFRNLGTFENFPQGNIEIENTINTGQIATAFYTNKKTENNGRIYIYNVDGYGIINDNNKAGFDNNGEIDMIAIDSTAFTNRHTGSDSILLKNTGKITITTTKLGIENTALGRVNNSGTISCLQSGGGIVNNGWFINTDTLIVSGGASSAGSKIGFLNAGKFFNHKHTEIKVFLNYGLHNTDSLRNEANALLFVQSCGNYTGSSAIYTNSLFVNNGEIFGGQNLGAAIINESNKKGFYNLGKINLNTTFGLGIINFSSTADSSFFYNTGPLNFLFSGGGPSPYPESGILWNHTKGSFKSIAKITFDSHFFSDLIGVLNQSTFLQADSIVFTKFTGPIIKNYGSMLLNKYLYYDASLNNLNKGLINSGQLTLSGKTHIIYQPASAYVREHLVENSGTILNKSYWTFDGNYDIGGVINSGIFNNDSTITFINLDKSAFNNTGNINNSNKGLIDVVFESAISGLDQTVFLNEGMIDNLGEIKINQSSNKAFLFNNGGKMQNFHKINITFQKSQAFYLQTPTDTLINMPGGEIIIDSVDFAASFLLDGNAIRMLNGYFENAGQLTISRIKNRSIEISGGRMHNAGILNIEKCYEWDAVWLANATLSNSGTLILNGASAQNLRAVFVNSTATLDNSSGLIELIDQAGIGLKLQGIFIDNSASRIVFNNNSRNTGLLFEDQTPGVLLYKGSMGATNSRSCALFDANAITEGKIDLRNCTAGITHLGTNAAIGHIQVSDNVLPVINYGLVELTATTRLASSLGNVFWTNYGIINDKTNGLVNIKFYQTSTPPIWPLKNEGLFISPFYGVLSSGIKENTNLVFTTVGTLPISNQWYTSRSKNTVAGDWHSTGHYFTPNSNADSADSLFFEYTPSGGVPIMVGIPHSKPASCPNPPVLRSLTPTLDYNWNQHPTWQGHRMPDYCDKVILSGQEGLYVPAGYKAKLNTIDFMPQPGNGRFFEIKSGAVMEINALPYH